MADTPASSDIQLRRLVWAAVQLSLGLMQMAGALVGLALLIIIGVSGEAFAACVVAGIATLASRLIFRGRSAADMVIMNGQNHDVHLVRVRTNQN